MEMSLAPCPTEGLTLIQSTSDDAVQERLAVRSSVPV